MIWHLLWLYPLIGVGLEAYHHYRSHKHGIASDNLVVAMMFLWPIGWYLNNTMFNEGVEETRLQGEREHEALLERVRQERLAPDPRLAEFDILLGIEPEPEDPEFWIAPHKGLSGRERYEANMARSRQFSSGGHIPYYYNMRGERFTDPKPPTLTELNQGLTNNNKGFSL